MSPSTAGGTAPVLCAELSPFWALVCDADASRDRVVMSRSGVGSACRAHLAYRAQPD
ncbi:c57a2f82-e08c-4115-ac9b-1e1a3fdd51d5 [Thermothielavioides terrestris]|uniref:C57a2f82-e08c-4115-ac9b-1e1a3fdd51d5 n=1 Tax=Thermothielavioides terrestris TaxID=2587410 RepID=A0A446B7G5_9PEZI|nr:c57a2f82-e08c-4115-ac9b-1e1a3fdd51d5 [Thermothielavioides terrestris]